jgi:hypothetical protein
LYRDGELDADLLSDYSPALIQTLRSLLHADPTMRPSALQLQTISAGRLQAPPQMNDQMAQMTALMAENERLRNKLAIASKE